MWYQFGLDPMYYKNYLNLNLSRILKGAGCILISRFFNLNDLPLKYPPEPKKVSITNTKFRFNIRSSDIHSFI